METLMAKKTKFKHTPDQLYEIFLECSNPQAPVKSILERHSLKPWDLAAIRKRIREAAVEVLAHPGKKGRKTSMVAANVLQRSQQELQEAKDALAAVGHELSLLKKRVN